MQRIAPSLLPRTQLIRKQVCVGLVNSLGTYSQDSLVVRFWFG